MGAIWEPQPWDSAFFGIKTARIVTQRLEEDALEQALAECRAWGAQVVHYPAGADHDLSVRLAERAGFHLVDVRVTLEWQALGPGAPPDDGPKRDWRAADLPALQAIARASYHDSRYYYDRRYPRERCDALYVEWITQSCRGAAERVIVAEQDGAVAGYITCHLPAGERHGRIGLLGVRADARGLGIGRRLLGAAQGWFSERGARAVAVVTQGRNIAAQRLYQRCGFATSDLGLWYHKWFEDP